MLGTFRRIQVRIRSRVLIIVLLFATGNMMHWRVIAHNFFCNTKQETFPLPWDCLYRRHLPTRLVESPFPPLHFSWRVPVPSISTSLSCGISAPRYLPAPCGNSHRFYPLQGNSLLKYATHLAPCPLVYFASVQTSQHRSSRAIHVNIFHQSFAIDSKYSSLCCKSGPKAPLQRTYSWRGCRRET